MTCSLQLLMAVVPSKTEVQRHTPGAVAMLLPKIMAPASVVLTVPGPDTGTVAVKTGEPWQVGSFGGNKVNVTVPGLTVPVSVAESLSAMPTAPVVGFGAVLIPGGRGTLQVAVAVAVTVLGTVPPAQTAGTLAVQLTVSVFVPGVPV